MRDRLSDQDIEAIFRGDAEDEVGLAEFLTRVRSSAEWSPDPKTQSEHVMAAAHAVNPGPLGEAPGQPPVRATEPAMKGIKLKIRTITRSALTWVVAAATVLLGTTGALGATNHLTGSEQTAVSSAARKLGRNVPDTEDLAENTLVADESYQEDHTLATTTTTLGDDSEEKLVEDTEPEDQTSLIVIDQNQNEGCEVDEQDNADEAELDQNQTGELHENETDEPDDDCEIEDTEANNEDQAEVEDTEEHDQKQVSDVDENEAESNDTEIDDHETEDEHHSGDTEEHDSGDYEGEGSSHEGSGD